MIIQSMLRIKLTLLWVGRNDTYLLQFLSGWHLYSTLVCSEWDYLMPWSLIISSYHVRIPFIKKAMHPCNSLQNGIICGGNRTQPLVLSYFFYLVPLDYVAGGEVSIGRQPFQIFENLSSIQYCNWIWQSEVLKQLNKQIIFNLIQCCLCNSLFRHKTGNIRRK